MGNNKNNSFRALTLFCLICIQIYYIACSLNKPGITEEQAYDICVRKLKLEGKNINEWNIKILTYFPIDSLRRARLKENDSIDSYTVEKYNEFLKKLENKKFWVGACCKIKEPRWGPCVYIYINQITGKILFYE